MRSHEGKRLTTGELASNEPISDRCVPFVITSIVISLSDIASFDHILSIVQNLLDCGHFVWFFSFIFRLIDNYHIILITYYLNFSLLWKDALLHITALFQCHASHLPVISFLGHSLRSYLCNPVSHKRWFFFLLIIKKLFILSHFDNFDQNLDTLYPSFVLNNNKNKTSPGFLLLSIITYTLLHQHILYFYWFLILFMTLLYSLYLFICLLMSATGCSDIYSAYTFLHFFLTYLYQNLYKWT